MKTFTGSFRTPENTQIVRISVEKFDMASVLDALEEKGIELDIDNDDGIVLHRDSIVASFPKIEGELYLELDREWEVGHDWE